MAPRWGQHRIDLSLRRSKEWLIWKAASGKKFDQMDFAEFLEDNTPDITNPSAATMLEVARDLKVKTDVDFNSSFQQANGTVHFKYSEQVNGKFGSGNVDIPDSFTVSIPVHVGGARVPLTARLRFRILSGKIKFWFDLLRAEEVEHNAFVTTKDAIAKDLGIKLISGTPAA